MEIKLVQTRQERANDTGINPILFPRRIHGGMGLNKDGLGRLAERWTRKSSRSSMKILNEEIGMHLMSAIQSVMLSDV